MVPVALRLVLASLGGLPSAGAAGGPGLRWAPPDRPALHERFEFLGPVLHVEREGRRGTAQGPAGGPQGAGALAGRRLMGVFQDISLRGEQLPLISPMNATELMIFPFLASLNGAYDVEKTLGEGDSGITYLAKDKVTHQEVAVKVFRLNDEPLTIAMLDELKSKEKEGSIHVGFTEEVIGECKKIRDIRETTKQDAEGDKHIVQCLHDGVADAVAKAKADPNADAPLYITMSYGGQTLEDWWSSSEVRYADTKKVSQWVRQAMRQLMLALRAMTHEGAARKWVHHDLKPEDIVVNSKGPGGEDLVLTLVDFGAALSDDDPDGKSFANPEYAPLDMVGRGFELGWTPPVHSYDVAAAATILMSLARLDLRMAGVPAPMAFVFNKAALEKSTRIDFLREIADCIAERAPSFSYRGAAAKPREIWDVWAPAFEKCLAQEEAGRLQGMIKDLFDGAKTAHDRRKALKPLLVCLEPNGEVEVYRWTQQIVSEWIETGFDQVLFGMYDIDPAKRPMPKDVLQAKWLSPDYDPEPVDDPHETVHCPRSGPVPMHAIWLACPISAVLILLGCCCHCCGKVPSPRYTGMLGCVSIMSSAMSGMIWFSNSAAMTCVTASLILGPAVLFAGCCMARRSPSMAGRSPSNALLGPWPLALYAGLVFCIVLAAAVHWTTGSILDMLALMEESPENIPPVIWTQVPFNVGVARMNVSLSSAPPVIGIATMLFGIWREDVHRRLSRRAPSARTVTGTEMQATSAQRGSSAQEGSSV